MSGGAARDRAKPSARSAAPRRQQRKQDPVAEEERAREYLLRALTSSAKSRALLAKGLAERDVAPELAEQLLDRFIQVGLINDSEYARMVTRTRFAERGLARRGIAEELRRKGVCGQDISEALEQITPEHEEEAARDLVRKRLLKMQHLDAATRTRRLAGMLGRKGYSGSTAMRVIRELVDDPEQTDHGTW